MPLDLMAQRQLTNKHGRSHCTPEQHTTKVYNNENKINQMKSLLLKKNWYCSSNEAVFHSSNEAVSSRFDQW